MMFFRFNLFLNTLETSMDIDLLHTLPEETWIYILSFCDVNSIHSIFATCTFFQRLTKENFLWMGLYRNRFGEQAKPRNSPLPVNWRNEFFWRENPKLRVQLFNEHPKLCLDILFREKIIETPLDLLKFLRDTKGIKHNIVYRLITSPSSFGFNDDIFINTIKEFDFNGLSILEALRIFLNEFSNLFFHGGQQMALTALSERYFECDIPYKKYYNSIDDVFMLFWSLVTINIDLHHPKVSKKIQRNTFISNIKKLNINLPEEYLSEVYREILLRPFTSSEKYYPLNENSIIFTGWLKTGKDKKRWIVLSRSHIIVYKNKKSHNYLKTVELFYNTALHTNIDPKHFTLENPNDSFTFKAPSTKSFNTWIQAIQQAIQSIAKESSAATELFTSEYSID